MSHPSSLEVHFLNVARHGGHCFLTTGGLWNWFWLSWVEQNRSWYTWASTVDLLIANLWFSWHQSTISMTINEQDIWIANTQHRFDGDFVFRGTLLLFYRGSSGIGPHSDRTYFLSVWRLLCSMLECIISTFLVLDLRGEAIGKSMMPLNQLLRFHDQYCEPIAASLNDSAVGKLFDWYKVLMTNRKQNHLEHLHF